MSGARLLALLLACLSPFAAMADAVEDVISDQLRAFQARDVTAAWDHASPAIRRAFGSPERFGEMVAGGYATIWNNDVVCFGLRMVQAGRVRQTVIVTDRAGASQVFDYDLVETGGGWKINGVRPLARDSDAA
ncbi:DUF4864 domain-containing protein [Celeribacter indicus]|uniref:DUF4864 domain-containing protein n=1 Tax=Celeribacter indicus TaxID=1208324 RepID=A0A0B5E4J9_9RHOB|nr:DUF4864 domain-containing protein [Celeribacter indicus]AJE48290.1 hypothetical protein P73_3575 [Celeribacter indicus]SDW71850.1 protein of unknown function [Celeribacter indicus]